MRVLVLGGRAPVALDHARRFAAQGSTVYVADSVPCRISSYGRAVAETFRLPPPRFAAGEFAKELARIIQRKHIDLVLPTCEEVFYVSRLRHYLPRNCSVFAPPFEQLRQLHSKLRFLDLAANCGAEVPASACVRSIREAITWSDGRPVVLKPEFSRFGVYVRLYPDGMPADSAELASAGDWVVQDFCAGKEICSYSVAVDGVVTAHVEYEPRYRIASSSSFYFDPCSAPGVRDFINRFVRKINFTGQISFDWIIGRDNRNSVLECNPRAISGLHLFDALDPLPAAITGEAGRCVTPRHGKPRMFSAIMLSAGLLAAIQTRRFGEWLGDWRRASDVLVDRGEIAPTLGGLLDLGSHSLRALSQNCSVREASTRDIEWDGQEFPL
jgi:predicted ATP-grasp superfamily ATP-dependent carboligase